MLSCARCDIAVLVRLSIFRTDFFFFWDAQSRLERRGRSAGVGRGGCLRGWFVGLLLVGGNHLRPSRGLIC